MDAASEQLTTDELSARIKYDVRTIRERLKDAVVADYAPGQDAEAAFKKAFTAGGGKVVDRAA